MAIKQISRENVGALENMKKTPKEVMVCFSKIEENIPSCPSISIAMGPGYLIFPPAGIALLRRAEDNF